MFWARGFPPAPTSIDALMWTPRVLNDALSLRAFLHCSRTTSGRRRLRGTAVSPDRAWRVVADATFPLRGRHRYPAGRRGSRRGGRAPAATQWTRVLVAGRATASARRCRPVGSRRAVLVPMARYPRRRRDRYRGDRDRLRHVPRAATVSVPGYEAGVLAGSGATPAWRCGLHLLRSATVDPVLRTARGDRAVDGRQLPPPQHTGVLPRARCVPRTAPCVGDLDARHPALR